MLGHVCYSNQILEWQNSTHKIKIEKQAETSLVFVSKTFVVQILRLSLIILKVLTMQFLILNIPSLVYANEYSTHLNTRQVRYSNVLVKLLAYFDK